MPDVHALALPGAGQVPWIGDVGRGYHAGRPQASGRRWPMQVIDIRKLNRAQRILCIILAYHPCAEYGIDGLKEKC